jgi:hypothetical protein
MYTTTIKRYIVAVLKIYFLEGILFKTTQIKYRKMVVNSKFRREK